MIVCARSLFYWATLPRGLAVYTHIHKGGRSVIKLLQLILEIGAGLLVIVMVYSQLLRPMVKKTPVFPMFRRRPALEREIESVNEDLEDKELKQDLAQKKVELNK
ncbi:MAG: hypothetical protein A3H76_06620 [Candidatus Lloydbacteria bacterium RIFCSPLOWO2_02_FULL_54_12]|nr:MAG: hypothetical protein A3H76_06620 [Candidatus Lloydbacteria bacterium RIFCSPLOWO2_02_FULL_54_12]